MGFASGGASGGLGFSAGGAAGGLGFTSGGGAAGGHASLQRSQSEGANFSSSQQFGSSSQIQVLGTTANAHLGGYSRTHAKHAYANMALTREQNHGQLLQMIAGLKAKMEAKFEAKMMAELDLRMKAQMKMLSGQYQERMGFQMAQMKV